MVSIEDERRRSLEFILSCLSSDCSIVFNVVKMCMPCYPADSLLGNNVLRIGSEYNVSVESALHGIHVNSNICFLITQLFLHCVLIVACLLATIQIILILYLSWISASDSRP